MICVIVFPFLSKSLAFSLLFPSVATIVLYLVPHLLHLFPISWFVITQIHCQSVMCISLTLQRLCLPHLPVYDPVCVPWCLYFGLSFCLILIRCYWTLFGHCFVISGFCLCLLALSNRLPVYLWHQPRFGLPLLSLFAGDLTLFLDIWLCFG